MKHFILFLFIACAFNNATAADLYWIGNGGNWSDVTHWSQTSGGSSCNCIPTQNDNVFFDANSFGVGGQTVNINQVAYCNSMNWTGALSSSTLGGDQTLNIYGSLLLSSQMNVTFTGGMYFKSNNPGNTIQTSGKTLPSISFDGLGGEWVLQDNLTTSYLYLNTGSLNANNVTINATMFNSTGNGIRSLILGSSTVNLSYSSSYVWQVSGSNVSVNAGTSTIILTGAGNPYFDASNFTYYNVTFNNPASTQVYLLTSNATFNNVSFAGNGYISGNNTFNNLTLGTSKTTSLDGTQIINGTFTCNGTCAIPAILSGGTLLKASGSVTINYVRLTSVTATGGATFTANNVTDFGNNNGWNINHPLSQNFYWIGNGGNWTDAFHWSLTSGGTSGSCIPGPYDNVFFDANSFGGGGQTVNINQVAYCNSMNWTGALSSSTLGGDQTLNIYGSLVLNSQMNVTFTGGMYFKSNNPGNTIQTSGKTLPSISFDGLGGEWVLQDNLTTSYLYLNTGSLNANNVTINATMFNSTGNGIRSLILGSSTVNLSYSSSYVWQVSGSNVSVNAGTSTIILTGAGNPYFDASNFTYYNVTFNNPASTQVYLLTSNATFNNVSFAGNGYISGNNTFNNLTLGTSKTTSLDGTQIINGTFTCNGTCAIPAILSGGTLLKASGSVTINYVRLTSVTATGGATFTANNVTDFGNNNGWNINHPLSQNFYWIGNGGNWTDAFHWSLTSGGTSGSCIPGPYDNVFFDANSFGGGGQTVNINQVAYCNSMNWTGALSSSTLGGDQTLNIYGSLVLNSQMNVTFTGGMYFKSNNPGNTIQTSGKTLPSISFDGLGGEWVLQDNLTTSYLYLNTGSLNANNVTINATMFNSTGNGIRSLILGSSTVNLSYSSSYVWQVSGSNVSVNAGTSTIILTGAGNPYFDASNFTYYNVTFNNPASTQVYLLTSNATFNNVSFAGNGYISGNNTFNNLTLGTSKTTSLDGTQIINGTFTCNGTAGILASISGGTILKPSGTVCLNYVSLTNSIATGGAAFYAGNSQDLGNNTGWLFQSCSTNNVEELAELPTIFSLSQNYPNPFNPSTNIAFSLPTKSFVLLKVFDLLGREVATLMSQEKPTGTYHVTFDASKLPSGIYFYRLQAGTFIETKKLILLR